MKASKFYISTFKEAPADAELVSHQLMIRAGLIKNLDRDFIPGCPWALEF